MPDEQNKSGFYQTKGQDLSSFPGSDRQGCKIVTARKCEHSNWNYWKFRSGRQDQAMFWLQAKGKWFWSSILPCVTPSGKYRGVLEVGQDITEITKLEGERRLLHWDSK